MKGGVGVVAGCGVGVNVYRGRGGPVQGNCAVGLLSWFETGGWFCCDGGEKRKKGDERLALHFCFQKF